MIIEGEMNILQLLSLSFHPFHIFARIFLAFTLLAATFVTALPLSALPNAKSHTSDNLSIVSLSVTY